MEAELVQTFRFEAAHSLPNVPPGHKCGRLHGHSYRVDVHVRGQVDDAKGWLMDFGDLKDICDSVLDPLDHADLNDIDPFDRTNPTSENLARYVYEQVAQRLPGPVQVSRVTVFESARSWATYTESR